MTKAAFILIKLATPSPKKILAAITERELAIQDIARLDEQKANIAKMIYIRGNTAHIPDTSYISRKKGSALDDAFEMINAIHSPSHTLPNDPEFSERFLTSQALGTSRMGIRN